MSTAAEWGKAYAKQAKADFLTRDSLARDSSIPVCQTLHLLQMACEKLCKAHLCYAGSKLDDLQSSHGYVAKTLPVIALQEFSRQGRPDRSYSREVAAVRQLAREIE